MAERSVKHFLKHKGYTDRKFETIKKYLGGWDDQPDELRRILVRAGQLEVTEQKKNNKLNIGHYFHVFLKKLKRKRKSNIITQ